MKLTRITTPLSFRPLQGAPSSADDWADILGEAAAVFLQLMPTHCDRALKHCHHFHLHKGQCRSMSRVMITSTAGGAAPPPSAGPGGVPAGGAGVPEDFREVPGESEERRRLRLQRMQKVQERAVGGGERGLEWLA